MSILQNLPVAEQVRDATQTGENTAARVGGLFVSIIQDAAQDIDAVAQEVTALPAQPFDDAEFHSTDNTGQEQSTGDQAIDFKSNGTVVKSLPVKVADAGYSGLMSASDKAKLDAIPPLVASAFEAIGELQSSANASEVVINTYNVNGDYRNSNTLPNIDNPTKPLTGIPSNIRGATKAGIVTAAIQNAVNLFGQGIELYVKAGETLQIGLLGARLYRGAVLEFRELDGEECSAVFSVTVNGTNTPVFSNETIEYSAGQGETFTFPIANAFDQIGFLNEFGSVQSFSITNTSARGFHARMRMTDAAESVTNYIKTLSVATDGNTVTISGRNNDNAVTTYATIPAATTSKAGAMTASDKIKLAEAVVGSAAVGSLSITQTSTTVEITINDATQQGGTIDTYQLPSATTTAAGVMTASDKNKLNGIAAGAEVNTLTGLSFDATTNPESAQTETVPVVNKVGNLTDVLSGGFVVDVIPTSGSLENRSMPKNGTNYHLGSISALAFDNNMAAMTLGCTVHFTAASSFIIVLPYAHEIGGVTNNPRYGARMADSVSLSCSAGEEYELDITTICAATGQPINVFALHTLVTPDATSNGLS